MRRPQPHLLSIVVPLYNEEEVLPLLRKRLEKLAQDLPCETEFLMISDGSTDHTAGLLHVWAESNPCVVVLEFSRNFGHQSAITAGLDHAAGDAVVIMDGDLQDPPELIHQMLAKYSEGFDVVYAKRRDRNNDTFIKKNTAKFFYWFMRRFVHKELPANVGEFRLMSRDVVHAMQQLREGHRFIRGLTTWLGYEQTAVLFDRPARPAGETKYPLSKMIRFAWDAVTSFSPLPLRLGIYVGMLAVLFGVGLGGYVFVRKFLTNDFVPGWATLVVLQCLMGGVTLMFQGTIGSYIGRIFEEAKGRPLYIVKRTSNLIQSDTVRPRAVLPVTNAKRQLIRRKTASLSRHRR